MVLFDYPSRKFAILFFFHKTGKIKKGNENCLFIMNHTKYESYRYSLITKIIFKRWQILDPKPYFLAHLSKFGCSFQMALKSLKFNFRS